MKRTPNEIAQAIKAEHDQATLRTARAVAKLFPVGSRVLVKANNPSRDFCMEVVRHSWGWDVLTVYGLNTVTQKRRRFYVGCDEVAGVELPKKGGKR